MRLDIRSPFIASTLETLEMTENATQVYRHDEKDGLMEPKFEQDRGKFKVILYNKKMKAEAIDDEFVNKISAHRKTPKSKNSIAKFLGFDKKPPFLLHKYLHRLPHRKRDSFLHLSEQAQKQKPKDLYD